MKTDEKNIYVLMNQEGQISRDTLTLIRKNLVNELARTNLSKALRLGREKLNKSNIYGLGYGGIVMWIVQSWNVTARNTTLKVPFLNQDIHDLEGYNKILALTDFE